MLRTLSRVVSATRGLRIPNSAFSASVHSAAGPPVNEVPTSKTTFVAATTAVGLAAAAYFASPSIASAKAAVENPPSIDMEALKEEIADLVDDGHGPLLVRLAWHASGTYDKVTKSGGSNKATMRFESEASHGANAGLHLARELLEPLHAKYEGISYGDLWTLAGCVAIEGMGGPELKWRSGRTDGMAEDATPDGRLPDADKGQIKATIQHIRDIFYRQGFNDQEIVALVGAHALGRCHTDRSGYTGPWTRAETTFSNEFFRELIENKWTLKEWNGPDQFEDPTGDLMMLPSDMALLWDKNFRKYTEMYAKDQDKFFADFASAWIKLIENGVPFASKKPWWSIF